MDTFKKVLFLTPYILFLLLGIGSYFLFQAYIDRDEKYKTYKDKVSLVLQENIQLNVSVNILQEKVVLFQKEKETLMEELSKKKIQIVEKEKIVYKEGKLTIPEDYEKLKDNYIVLNELYSMKTLMYDQLFEQSQKDYATIEELRDSLSDVQLEKAKLIELAENPVLPSLKLYSQTLFAGVGFPQNLSLGYGITIKEKVQGIITVSYPLEISLLVGIRL